MVYNKKTNKQVVRYKGWSKKQAINAASDQKKTVKDFQKAWKTFA